MAIRLKCSEPSNKLAGPPGVCFASSVIYKWGMWMPEKKTFIYELFESKLQTLCPFATKYFMYAFRTRTLAYITTI